MVERVRRLYDIQHTLASIAKGSCGDRTIGETGALFVRLRRRGETQHGRGAAVLG